MTTKCKHHWRFDSFRYYDEHMRNSSVVRVCSLCFENKFDTPSQFEYDDYVTFHVCAICKTEHSEKCYEACVKGLVEVIASLKSDIETLKDDVQSLKSDIRCIENTSNDY